MPRGTFVVIDGIDGSGKGTLLLALARHLRRRGRRLFDLRAYTKRTTTFPRFRDLKNVDVLLSSEPTYGHVGRALREEMVQYTKRYSAERIADAFSLDRAMLYEHVLLPFLRRGGIVLQERSFLSSLVYQPLQSSKLTVPRLLALPGNRLALTRPPDLIIVPDLPPRVALRRLQRRPKKDQSYFERLGFLTRLNRRFESEWFRRFVRRLGSRLVYLPTDKPVAESERDVANLWRSTVGRSAGSSFPHIP